MYSLVILALTASPAHSLDKCRSLEPYQAECYRWPRQHAAEFVRRLIAIQVRIIWIIEDLSPRLESWCRHQLDCFVDVDIKWEAIENVGWCVRPPLSCDDTCQEALQTLHDVVGDAAFRDHRLPSFLLGWLP